MRVAPGPLDPVGVSAAEYESLPREESSDSRRLCPWVPSPLEIADHAVRLADITSEDVVIDLGCGTGEVIMRMSAQTGCQCQGVDISPSLISTARLRASQRGLDGGVEPVDPDVIRDGDGCDDASGSKAGSHCGANEPIAQFKVADFCSPQFVLPPEATLVFVYLLPRVLSKIRPLLQEAVACHGVRVVSNQYHPDFLGPATRSYEGPDGRWQLKLFERPRSA